VEAFCRSSLRAGVARFLARSLWEGGIVPAGEGMYAVNDELPPVAQIGRINCAGVTNLFFRAMRKRIPTLSNPL